MRAVRGAVVGLAVVLLATGAAVAGPKARRVKLYRAGEVFCTSRVLVWGAGAVVIRDRCYVVALVRQREGAFLAFLDPDVHLPPGQLVRLNTPAGAKLRGRIFYLVPVQAVVAIPVDALVVVPVRVEEEDSRLTVILTGPHAPNLTVIFSIRL
ncbi:MAG: hypothetical protein QN193_03945 [Armatimonadota bacterium]|nr:hypothetical protein [Armatimonadota bacterium]MDR7445376.1 hypothetical protein [Armatimonadota bacterium]MDR7569737.1 hypothetical protein [Armatimonadota bacterium]MDR7614109.1 hypothetical protein [Armatimonadota bacterium]